VPRLPSISAADLCRVSTRPSARDATSGWECRDVRLNIRLRRSTRPGLLESSGNSWPAPQAQPTVRKNLQTLVTRYVDSYFEGNIMAAAEAAGCGRVPFHNWYTGKTTPRIDLLLRLCYELNIPLASLATGHTVEVEDGTLGRRAAAAKRRRETAPQRTADQIRQALLIAAK
jgi:hypothetical protein